MIRPKRKEGPGFKPRPLPNLRFRFDSGTRFETRPFRFIMQARSAPHPLELAEAIVALGEQLLLAHAAQLVERRLHIVAHVALCH